MGFFSKIWKGVKGAVKRIGKGIKSAVKSVGKFVNRLGVAGQIGLSLVLPGIGGLIGNAAGVLASSSNVWMAGVGKIIQTAGKFASTAGNVFKTVTDGVLGFVKKIGGSIVNKAGSLLGRQTPLISSAPSTVTEGFQQWMKGVADDVRDITSPFRKVAEQATTEAIDTPWEEFLDKAVNGGFEETVEEAAAEDFINSFQVPRIEPVTADMPAFEGVEDQFLQPIIEEEAAQNTSFFQRVADNTNRLAGRGAEVAVDTVASQVGAGLAQRTGLSPDNTPRITNVTNVIPQFNSAPITQAYEAAGFNYGAMPETRMQYYAANAFRPILPMVA